MSVFGATHARFEGDKLTHLKVGLIDTTKPAWDSPMKEMLVLQVVDLIVGGDSVYLVQGVDGVYPPGQKLAVKAHSDGVEYLVEEGDPMPGRGIKNLPAF